MIEYERKNIIRVVNCFAFFFVLRFIEEFLILPNASVNTHSMLACVFGIIVLLFYLRSENKSVEKIGLIFSRNKIKKGFFNAVLLNAIPLVTVYPLMYYYLKSNYSYVRVTLYYDSAQNCYSNGVKVFLLYMFIGLIVSVVHSIFYELTFRGLLMHLSSKTFSFTVSNIIQASLYTFWFLISAVRVAVTSGEDYAPKSILVLIGFFVIYEFLVGIKLGLCKYASGALWVCLFDHLAFGFICDVLHFQASTTDGQLVTGYYNYVILICYQVISFIIACIYFTKKKRQIREARQEATARRHSTSKRLSDSSV